MSTTTPDYGEPWSKKEHNWSDSSLYSHGGKKYLFTHSIDDGSTTEDNQQEREDEQSRLLNRITSCTNALAGIPDPEAVIQANAKFLNLIIPVLESMRPSRIGEWNWQHLAVEAKKALNLLSPKSPLQTQQDSL